MIARARALAPARTMPARARTRARARAGWKRRTRRPAPVRAARSSPPRPPRNRDTRGPTPWRRSPFVFRMDFPYLGHGIGMRPKHYGSLLGAPPPVDWLEVISENFMVPGGRPLSVLEKVRREVPVVLHGVSLSIGGCDALDRDYLNALRELAARVEPAWVSDHLCWGTHGKRWAHELLPLPYTEEAVEHVVARVLAVQDVLRRRILLENVSSYVAYQSST